MLKQAKKKKVASLLFVAPSLKSTTLQAGGGIKQPRICFLGELQFSHMSHIQSLLAASAQWRINTVYMQDEGKLGTSACLIITS